MRLKLEVRPAALSPHRIQAREKLPHQKYLNLDSTSKFISAPSAPSSHCAPKMPRSKRAKVVHLTKVDKNRKDLSAKLYANVQSAVSSYPFIFVFAVDNMRNNYLKEVRAEFAQDGRIFFGKTKVMAKALGITEEEEQAPGLAKLAEHLKGDVGLLFTRRSPESVLEYLGSFSELDFARAGSVAAWTFTIPSGPVYSLGGTIPASEDVLVPASMETQLRGWEMPTHLEKGKVVLDVEYTVCKEGDVLNSNQTALLKSFGVAMAEFRVMPRAYWSSESGHVTVVNEGDGDEGSGMDED